MSNVYKFPDAGREPPKLIPHNAEEEGSQKSNVALGILLGLLMFLRTILYLVMYWLRLPVLFLSNLVCGLGFFGALFGWMVSKPDMLWLCGILSFTAFVIRWGYDFILAAISPEEVMRTL